MISKEEIKDRVSNGWIRSRMTFEVMAADSKTTSDALAEHIVKFKKVPDNEVISEKYEDVIEVLPPPRDIEQAFSQVVEVEVLSHSIESMLLAVVSFGPSSIEVLEPKEMIVKYGTVQTVMNTASDLMHRFAAQGIGGIVISNANKDKPR